MRDCVNCLVLNLRKKKTKEGEIGGMFGTGYWWYGWKQSIQGFLWETTSVSGKTIENETEQEEVVGALNFGIKGTLVK